jgi:hypothetical protein
MSKGALTRTNLLLETGKVRRLRKALQSRSNSEVVRRAVDERLAVETGLAALRNLRKLGGPEDVFERARLAATVNFGEKGVTISEIRGRHVVKEHR